MSSRKQIIQSVSETAPVGAALGDEWFQPSSDRLYKRMTVRGVVGWTEIQLGQANTITTALNGTVNGGLVIGSNTLINDSRTFINYGLAHSAFGSVSGAVTINLFRGNYFSATIAGITTWTFSNPLASPNACGFVLELTGGGAFAITWPAAVRWPGGTAPTLTAGAGVDVLVFITDDGGTNWRGVASMLDSKAPA